MESIRIKNLRSITDSGEIKLKPVTLIVGENSSGKSSFLRLYPLLKQSIEVKTNSPILWYTENVDFGSFGEAVSSRDMNKDIIINLKFNSKSQQSIDNNINSNYIFAYHHGVRDMFYKPCDISIEIHLSAMEDKNICYISKTNIYFEDNEINIEYSQDNKIESLYINESKLTSLVQIFTVFKSSGMLPQLGITNRNDVVYASITFGGYVVRTKNVHNLMINSIRELVKKSNIGDNTISKIIQELKLGSSEDILKDLRKRKSLPKTLKSAINMLDKDSVEIGNVKNLLITSYIPDLLEFINERINNYFTKSYYIAPVRASAERYYRIQDLAIDEIDSKGRNIPSILNNMEKEEREKFELWMMENFGFYPQVKQLEGHLSININNGQVESNMADTGFGYSQILPIVLQMWKIIEERRGEKVTFVIEQPELHLHPRLQGKLIEALIKMIRLGNKNQFRIIIETHSETIINKIGHLVYKSKVSNSEVGIYVFNKGNAGGTEVTESRYDSDGFLENWPIGFFEPEEE